MQAEIIAIGTELVLGSTVDTNSSWLAQQLNTLGIDVRRITLVGDHHDELVTCIRQAWGRTQLVVCTGGLGPTADDRTRAAVAEALNKPLEFHQALLDQIAARFRSFGRTMSESNRQQAFVPAGAYPIANARGTAPVFRIHEHHQLLWVLPGVPSEMKFLVETEILPYLREECGLSTVSYQQSVYLSGTSEAEAGEAIADLMNAVYPVVGISAKAAQYEVRISAQGTSLEQVQADVQAVADIVRERLAPYVLEFGVLEREITSILKIQQQTLALYEGLRFAPVYTALARIEDGTALLAGVTIHPLDEPIDAQAAASLARSAAISVQEQWRTTYGLAIQPALPDADGWTPICIALVGPKTERSVCRKIDLRAKGTKGIIATAALEVLRNVLKE